MAATPADPRHPGIQGGRGASNGQWCWLAWCGCSQQGAGPQKCHASLPSAPVSASTCCPVAIDGCSQGCSADWGHSAPGCLSLSFLHPWCCRNSQFSCACSYRSAVFAPYKYMHVNICVCIYTFLYTLKNNIYVCTPSTKSHLSTFLFKSRWIF